MASTRKKTLRETVREIVERDVLRTCAKSAKGWMVLVLDSEASKVLTPVLGMYDLMEEKVSLVESLELKRQPFREMDVIYIAAATDASVRAITSDWRSQTPYAQAHVFFLSQLSEGQLNSLAAAVPSSKLKNLVELNLHFLAVESQSFTLASPDSFGFGSGRSLAELEASRKLATLCATVGIGSVRYRVGNERLLQVAKSMPLGGGDGVLLLLDRSDDPATPLLHEYTYQALVQDMLEVEGEARDKVRYEKSIKSGGKMEDVAILGEKDELWVEMRHRHVAKVVDTLRARVEEFLRTNSGAASLSRGKSLSLGDMASALKKLPEFQAATALLDKHMTIAHECLTRFHSANLLDASQLEQTLITGKDDDGIPTPPGKVLDEVVACVSARPSSAHSTRLAACYFVAKRGRVSESERSKLLNALRPTSDQLDALLQLARLVAAAGGVPLAKDAAAIAENAPKKRTSRRPKKKSFSSLKFALKSSTARSFLSTPASNPQTDEDDDVAASRYTPPIKAVLEALAEERLPESMYEALRKNSNGQNYATPSKLAAQSLRSSSFRGASSGTRRNRAVGPKIVVCVLGGVSFSELRVAYEVAAATNRHIIIGATTLLSPQAFLHDLAVP